MAGFVDLHSHWVPDIDDGVRSVDEGLALLRGLRGLGFERVVATPHMRPGMFDNDRARIEAAYAAMHQRIASEPGLPALGLASEHYFDDVIFQRLLGGEGIAYPGGKAILIELHAEIFPVRFADRVIDLLRRQLRPVLAHPERYAPVWTRPELLDPIVDAGAALQLDVAALAGKYGRRPQRSAEYLLEEGYYYAAGSDAHRPADVDDVRRGIERLTSLAGREEAQFLLSEGPRNLLDGRVMTAR